MIKCIIILGLIHSCYFTVGQVHEQVTVYKDLESALMAPLEVSVLNISTKKEIDRLDDLYKLQNLEHLTLYGPVRDLPNNISELKKLKSFSILISKATNKNDLLSKIATISSLERLSIVGDISDVPTLKLDKLGNLRVLELNGSNLKSFNLGRLHAPGLEELRIYHNAKHTSIEISQDAIESFGSLRTLIASFCGLREVPSGLFKLRNLRVADFSDNKIARIPEIACSRPLLINLGGNAIRNLTGLVKVTDPAGVSCSYNPEDCPEVMIYLQRNPLCK